MRGPRLGGALELGGPLLMLGTLLGGCAPADQGPTPADRAPRVRERQVPPASGPHGRAAPSPRVRRTPRPARRVAPPARRRAPAVQPASWTRQRAAWTRLLKRVTPLARKGAWLPTFKLRKHFRRQGVWSLPSLDPRKLSAAERKLLSSQGPASLAEANGPAGRQIWVEASGAPGRKLARQICDSAAACGLGCTFNSKPPPRGLDAVVRRLVRLRADHDLVLRIAHRPTERVTDLAVPRKTDGAPALDRAIRQASVGLVGTTRFVATPLPRLGLGITVTGDPARAAAADEPKRLGQALCRLASAVGDRLMQRWHGSRTADRKRAKALASWLGLRFLDRPVHSKRPPLEHRYIRRHYRDRVFNWRRRADGAYLIRPAMVVLHHTGGLSLRSALYTLTSLRLGSRAGLTHPTSLSVGVPYVVARNGRLYRLFKDDDRFGRHIIGLNHSAIGVENVGTKRSGFTAAQFVSNVRLVQYLALRHPLRYLVGHREVYQMARTPYYLEAVPRYCSNKNDPTWRALRRIRKSTRSLGLATAPTTRPVLKDCKGMRRYFKQRRRAARLRPR